MFIVDIFLILFALIGTLRVEHLVASDFWIAFSGPKWKRRVSRMSIATQSDVGRMWKAYLETGGGKLPFLFFGIKSYRLFSFYHANWGRPWRSRSIAAVRLLWRYYIFSPLASCIVIVFSFVPSQLSAVAKIALLVLAFSTVVGMLAIAAEALLAAVVLGSWAILYHRWPKPGKSRQGFREFLVSIGSIALAVLAIFALLLCVAVRFHAYPDLASATLGTETRGAAALTFGGFFSNTIAPAPSLLAFFTGLTVSICYVAYFLFLLSIASDLWRNG